MRCDDRVLNQRKRMHKKNMETNIKNAGKCSLKVEEKLMPSSILETIRIVDGVKAKKGKCKRN